jgi:type IV secretory pathway VirB10-like protein
VIWRRARAQLHGVTLATAVAARDTSRARRRPTRAAIHESLLPQEREERPMKQTTMLMSILVIAACGGNKPEPVEPKEAEPEAAPTPEVAAKLPDPEPAPEPAPPPPPKAWHAKAELTPVKGTKIKAATVTFSQEEGEPVTVASTGWFEGIKAGKYHLVVHEAAACGPNATKAGKPMAAGTMAFTVVKGMDALTVDKADAIQLDGDAAIVGHTLALHDDKKGKPNKVLACGSIAASGGE